MKKHTLLSDYGVTSQVATHLQIEVYYSKGGMNFFNYKEEPRGYYAAVTPVTLEDNIISFSCFSGRKYFLLEVNRKSERSMRQAIKLFTPEIEKALCDSVTSGLAKKASRYDIEKKIGISLPPKFEGMTEEEILKLPVQVVDVTSGIGSLTYPNLAAAQEAHDLKLFCGAMYGEVCGRPALRFESQAAYKILSN